MARKLTSHRRLSCLMRRLALLACVGSVAAAAPGAAHAANLLGEPTASLFWAVNASTIMTVFQNGECTELAADKRPDILQTIVEGFIGSELARGVLTQGELVLSMPPLNARYWLADAEQVGLPTGHKPSVGALIVFQPGTLGAGPSGHIAYVQRVNRNGSFRIAQMHAPNLFQVTHEKLPARTARLAGVGFIY